MNKNHAISFCRVISMIMILLCHIIQFYTFIPGSSFLGLFLDCAVYTFFGISGYLYGKKEIGTFSKWIKKRIISICIPAGIFSIVVLVIRCIIGESTTVSAFFVYPLCLKGFSRILPPSVFAFPEIPVLGPLWFITVIMICYCLIPVLEKLRKRNIKMLMPSIALSLVVSFVLNYFLSVNWNYFIVFAVAYFMSSNETIEKLKINKYAVFTAFTVGLQLIRLLIRHYFDETSLYNAYIPLSHTFLGLWLLISILFVFGKYNFNSKFLKVLNYFDGLSFYIYIVHGCFFRGKLNVYEITNNYVLQTLMFFAFSFASALILQYVTKQINKALLKK